MAELQTAKKRRVGDQGARVRLTDLPYASSSRIQDDAFPAPSPYGGPVAGPSSSSDYTAYSDDLALGPDNRGSFPDFAYTNGLWFQQDAPLDNFRGATVTPVHMDAPAGAQVYNQALEGHYAGGQQYCGEPGPSAQVAPQTFAPPHPQSPSFGLDWNDPLPNLACNDEVHPSAQPQLDAPPRLDAQSHFSAQPHFYAQPHFNVESEYNNQFNAEPQLDSEPHFGAGSLPLWQNEPYEQPQLPIVPELVPGPQYVSLPPLAQPAPIPVMNFQLFEPALPLEVPPEPLAFQPASPALVPQGDGFGSPADMYAGAPLPELPWNADLLSYEGFPELYEAPAPEYSFHDGVNFDWGLGSGLEGILPPDSWALDFSNFSAPNPLAPNAAYGIVGEPLLHN